MTGTGGSVQRQQVLRHVASGVAVLTVWHGDEAQGSTVSTVTTLSRQPLTIGVCLRQGSTIGQLIRTGRRFAVNVLAGTQAHVATWFADPARPAGLAQFDTIDWEPDPFSGAPLIGGSLAHIGCQLRSTVPAGDHDLLIADVVHGSAAADRYPLVSYAGGLHDGLLRRVPRLRPAATATKEKTK